MAALVSDCTFRSPAACLTADPSSVARRAEFTTITIALRRLIANMESWSVFRGWRRAIRVPVSRTFAFIVYLLR